MGEVSVFQDAIIYLFLCCIYPKIIVSLQVVGRHICLP